jgi:exopolyphosphatase / guanosine-5'-triphosphate,3'-diphosphate pyrophosphatase
MLDDKKDLKLAAIDIGSNALRFQLSRGVLYPQRSELKRLEYLRFPLRLGSDVFSQQPIINDEHQEVFIQVMGVFKSMMRIYKVDDYLACATSAMREAQNGQELIQRVKHIHDLDIEIISGDREAEIINKAIYQYIGEQGNYLHIDVGGGSTEINIYKNKEKIATRSFQLGSVRLLAQQHDDRIKDEWVAMRNWIQYSIKNITGEIIPIATGGNINKLYDLAEKVNKVKKKKQVLSIKDLKFLYQELHNRDYQTRLVDFSLNEDRADIIVPASTIYIEALQAIKAKEVLVPKVGLREGITQVLFQKHFGTQEG